MQTAHGTPSLSTSQFYSLCYRETARLGFWQREAFDKLLQMTEAETLYRLSVSFALHLNQKHGHICWSFVSSSRNVPASSTVTSAAFSLRHQKVEQFWSLTLAETSQQPLSSRSNYKYVFFWLRYSKLWADSDSNSKVDGIYQSICFQSTLNPTFTLASPLFCQLPAI